MRLVSDPNELAGATQADLTQQCGISSSIANDSLGIALAAEHLSESKAIYDLAKDPETNRANAEPIQPGCTCYTCSSYSISYLFHLCEVKEMNYNVLLAIYNMHTLDKFFQEMQRQDVLSADYISAFLLRNFLS